MLPSRNVTASPLPPALELEHHWQDSLACSSSTSARAHGLVVQPPALSAQLCSNFLRSELRTHRLTFLTLQSPTAPVFLATHVFFSGIRSAMLSVSCKRCDYIALVLPLIDRLSLGLFSFSRCYLLLKGIRDDVTRPRQASSSPNPRHILTVGYCIVSFVVARKAGIKTGRSNSHRLQQAAAFINALGLALVCVPEVHWQ